MPIIILSQECFDNGSSFPFGNRVNKWIFIKLYYDWVYMYFVNLSYNELSQNVKYYHNCPTLITMGTGQWAGFKSSISEISLTGPGGILLTVRNDNWTL